MFSDESDYIIAYGITLSNYYERGPGKYIGSFTPYHPHYDLHETWASMKTQIIIQYKGRKTVTPGFRYYRVDDSMLYDVKMNFLSMVIQRDDLEKMRNGVLVSQFKFNLT